MQNRRIAHVRDSTYFQTDYSRWKNINDHSVLCELFSLNLSEKSEAFKRAFHVLSKPTYNAMKNEENSSE